MEEKVNAIFVLEILGKPPKYIQKTLSKIVDMLGKEKDVEIISKNIAEPKLLEQEKKVNGKTEGVEEEGEKSKKKGGQEGIFTSFAEIELKTNMQKLLLLAFAYMPSHIDIITPENLKIRNSDMNLFFNELIKRLHQYDELAKGLMIERQMIAEQIEEGKIKLTGEKSVEKPEKQKKKKNRKKSEKTKKN